MARVFVAGVEDSGTRWVTCLLNAHPDIDIVHHYSNPGGAEFQPLLLWAERKGLDPMDDIVLVVRDMSCVRASRQASGAKPRGGAVADTALEQIWHDLEALPNPVMVVSYEALVASRDRYLTHIFRQLGVSPTNYPYGFHGKLRFDWFSVNAWAKDGNAKHFGTHHD